jgi:membrane protease YdiL (CAAX protease family)
VKAALVGLGVAAALFPWVFRSKRGNFWGRMPVVAGSLGLLALIVRPELRQERPTAGDVGTALLSALGLYGVFQVGDRVARQAMPRGSDEIAAIYQLRRAAPRWLIALLLATVIGPAEELFWRGVLQDSLARRFGPIRGAAAAAACYGAVHLGSGNLTLAGAAATAGVFWGLQYAVQRRLPALIISHIIWDIWIFLVAPTGGAEPRPDSPR